MATFLFHEDTQIIPPIEGQLARKVTRYYYEDVSSQILARKFVLFPSSERKPIFDGNENIPLDEASSELKRRLRECLLRRMSDEELTRYQHEHHLAP